MSESEADPWRIDLVPLRTGVGRREADLPPDAPQAPPPPPVVIEDEINLVKLIGNLARVIDRIEIRLSRIERALRVEEQGTSETATMRRLRRERPTRSADPAEPLAAAEPLASTEPTEAAAPAAPVRPSDPDGHR